MLEFQEEGHVYTYGGNVVPGVTQILEPLSGYMGVPDWQLAIAADRGSYVHKMCELYNYGTLEEYEPEYQGYLDAWVRFVSESGFEVELCEHRVYHPKHVYAGTLDYTGYLGKKRGVLDVKATATLMPAVGPQTSAYAEALKASGEKVDFRMVVLLKPDGTYKAPPLTNRRDFATFTSCLNIMRWREEHGYV
jgi:hypothetical protein